MKRTRTLSIFCGGLALSMALAACEYLPEANNDGEQVVTEQTTTERSNVDSDAGNDTIYKDSAKLDGVENEANSDTVSTSRKTTVANDDPATITKQDKDIPADQAVKDDAKIAAAERTAVRDSFDSDDPEQNPQNNTPRDLVGVTMMEQDLSTFHQLLMLAGLKEQLESGRYTVLAPTNQAFAQVPKAQMDSLRKNKTRLRQVLMYHLIKNPVSSGDLAKQKTPQTLFEGRRLTVAPGTATKPTTIQQAQLVRANIWSSNGLVHMIDKVLIPSDLQGNS